VVLEIKEDRLFTAIRGSGASLEADGSPFAPTLSESSELSNIFWTMGFRGRPAEPLVTVLGELIDLSSVDGGCFDIGSASYCITRILTGQMDAYLDPGQRMADVSGAVRELFLVIGHGALLNNYSYDLAAASLIASECGAQVGDAYGRPLDAYPLVPEGEGGQISCAVSSCAALHEKVLAALERGIARMIDRYGR
jgi:myo-inositol-1(or 4)-monophosphatase